MMRSWFVFMLVLPVRIFAETGEMPLHLRDLEAVMYEWRKGTELTGKVLWNQSQLCDYSVSVTDRGNGLITFRGENSWVSVRFKDEYKDPHFFHNRYLEVGSFSVEKGKVPILVFSGMVSLADEKTEEVKAQIAVVVIVSFGEDGPVLEFAQAPEEAGVYFVGE